MSDTNDALKPSVVPPPRRFRPLTIVFLVMLAAGVLGIISAVVRSIGLEAY